MLDGRREMGDGRWEMGENNYFRTPALKLDLADPDRSVGPYKFRMTAYTTFSRLTSKISNLSESLQLRLWAFLFYPTPKTLVGGPSPDNGKGLPPKNLDNEKPVPPNYRRQGLGAVVEGEAQAVVGGGVLTSKKRF